MQVDDPTDEQGKDEIATAIAVGAKDTVEADLAGGAECGGGVAVWQAADDGEGVTLDGDDSAALEHAAQPFNVGRGPVGKIAQVRFAPCRLRGSSRAAGSRVASSDSERLRCT